jgi:nucleoside-diphosphate-sugar epimerase
MARIVIAGCGYVGTALGLQLCADGDEVYGLRRSPDALPSGIRPLARDLASGEPPDLPEDVDFGVYCVGAKAGTEAAYRAAYVDGLGSFLQALSSGHRKPHVLFTSSTSVYAQSRGEWVDEDSKTEPIRFSGRILLEAETLCRARGLPATVVRFGGIYGPGRTRLLERVARGEVAADPGAPIFTNRIHRDDAAGVLRFLMRRAARARSTGGAAVAERYLAVDSLPASQAEVYAFLATCLGGLPPERGRGRDSADAVSSPSPPLERAGSKRCSNARLLAAGYRFLYPTFREGYLPLVAEHLAPRADAVSAPEG